MLKIIFTGNLGRDPEMRFRPDGTPVTNLNVATHRKYKGPDGNPVKETTWLRVSVWGAQAEACNQYLKKGSKVCVEGRLRPDPQTGGPHVFTRQDGTAGASFEVTAFEVEFLDSRSNGEGGSEEGAAPSEQATDEDIPF